MRAMLAESVDEEEDHRPGDAVLAQAMNATMVVKVAVRIWWMRLVFMRCS